MSVSEANESRVRQIEFRDGGFYGEPSRSPPFPWRPARGKVLVGILVLLPFALQGVLSDYVSGLQPILTIAILTALSAALLGRIERGNLERLKPGERTIYFFIFGCPVILGWLALDSDEFYRWLGPSFNWKIDHGLYLVVVLAAFYWIYRCQFPDRYEIWRGGVDAYDRQSSLLLYLRGPEEILAVEREVQNILRSLYGMQRGAAGDYRWLATEAQASGTKKSHGWGSY